MTDIMDLKSKVMQALEAADYDVAEGRADLFRVEETKDLVPAFNTCFGNNPAAPYIVPAVPVRDGETYDYGDSMRRGSNGDGQELHWTYRLEADEAILMFGNLPPEAAFIGYETFLFTRYFDGNDVAAMDWLTHGVGVQHQLTPSPDNLLYDNAPITDGAEDRYKNDPNRVILFANGPTINRRTLEDKFKGDIWEKQAIFSTSADADFAAKLNTALGDELAKIHVHSPLGDDLQLGLGRQADDFWTLMRYAVPADREASDAWRNSVADQLVVLRVSKKGSTGVTRHPPYQFEEKTADTDERPLAVGLQKIADSVSETLSFADASQQIGLPLSAMLHAPLTIPTAMSAVGATHDADYRTSSAMEFDGQGVLAIVGVNHAQTGNSTYVSLGIYDSTVWEGIRGISQALEYPAPGPLNGSVEGFFSLFGAVPPELAGLDLSKYYVHVVARPGTVASKLEESLYCTVVHETDDPADEDRVVLPAKNPIRITERAYLNPNPLASCGPDHKKLLSMIVIEK